VLRIYIEIFGAPIPDVTTYIVHHDSAELAVGDPPFPLKARNPDLKVIYDRLEDAAMLEMRGEALPVLSHAEKARIKICDLLEMWEFGLQERMMGNRYAQPIVEDTRRTVIDMINASGFPDEDYRRVSNFIVVRERVYA
jgi:hypothetical protein